MILFRCHDYDYCKRRRFRSNLIILKQQTLMTDDLQSRGKPPLEIRVQIDGNTLEIHGNTGKYLEILGNTRKYSEIHGNT